jgi:hypothetical protein
VSWILSENWILDALDVLVINLSASLVADQRTAASLREKSGTTNGDATATTDSGGRAERGVEGATGAIGVAAGGVPISLATELSIRVAAEAGTEAGITTLGRVREEVVRAVCKHKQVRTKRPIQRRQPSSLRYCTSNGQASRKCWQRETPFSEIFLARNPQPMLNARYQRSITHGT